MNLSLQGSFRLFRAAGIDVYLHWSWFLVAFLMIGSKRPEDYQTTSWKVVEYVSLFGLVLLHEFGHALACRSVGGSAELIVLWPLGGVAFVAPPSRPGAVLWSIVAGPLVNFVLALPLFGLRALSYRLEWHVHAPDLHLFVVTLAWINLGLLIFNMLPIYPLDGGQVLHALLWFALGRWSSLMVVSLGGMLLGGAFLMLCLLLIVAQAGLSGPVTVSMLMLAFMGLFIVSRSLLAFQHARAVLALEALPRHQDSACPSCGIGPPHGPYWVCEHCQTRFDLFDYKGHCPGCGAWYLNPICPHCHQRSHIDNWERDRWRTERSPSTSDSRGDPP
jgi:Zn-dependent protease